MNVLSLFDGMSCGQQALERAEIKVDNYFASEIDKYAIQVTMANYPNTKQLGSVVSLNGFDLPKIDLLIGGSPCQSFSFAGKRKGMSTKDEQEILTLEHYLQLKAEGFEFEGQSYLFWEYMRLLNEIKPKYFLLENVKMSKKWKDILSKAIGIEPILINSNLLSAQNRQRLYWTNIPNVEQPQDKELLLKHILQNDVEEKYFLSKKMIEGFEKHKVRHDEKGTGFSWKPTQGNKKASCLRANGALAPTDNIIIVNNKGNITFTKNYLQWDSNGKNNRSQCDRAYYYDGKSGTLMTNVNLNVLKQNIIRRLTPIECERLQTVKDNYTNFVSDSQRYRMLGNGWTVDVIAHIFKYII